MGFNLKDIHIKKGNWKDWGELFPLVKSLFPELSCREILYLLTTWKENTFLAFCEEKIVGFYIFFSEGENIRLGYIGVNQNVRGLGVGTKILSNFLVEIEKYDYKDVILSVLKKNKKAISIYEKFGFVCIGNEGDKVAYRLRSPTLVPGDKPVVPYSQIQNICMKVLFLISISLRVKCKIRLVCSYISPFWSLFRCKCN